MRRILITLMLAALLGTSAAALPADASAASCPTGWGSLAESAGDLTMSRAPITAVRAGRQPCYDRVVFDVAGPLGAYRVQYVSQITGIASGNPISVGGGARLRVTVFDPAGTMIVPRVDGFEALRAIVNAGSFEGVTEFGVGVRARLPFRTFVLDGPGTSHRLVLDVAHHW